MSTYIGNNEISSIYIGSSEITSIYVGTDLVYSGGTTPPTPTGDTTNYLCFTSQQDGSSVALKKNSSPSSITLEYSTDKENWNTWDLSGVTLNSGDTMYIRGDNASFSKNGGNYQFVMSGSIAASGSIMTLLDSTDSLRTIPNNNAFERLFYGCASLTTAPELPATALTNSCYYSMFQSCSSLTTAPELPATTIAPYCYSGMFHSTRITSAPVLPATTLAESCYRSMFYLCRSLVSVPKNMLPATTLAPYCYRWMFNECGFTTAPDLPATALTQECYCKMFQGCGNLTASPILPAPTLVNGCYQEMFSNCRKLISVTTYANDISASNCISNWMNSVSSTGTFYNNGSATYQSGASGIPSGWTEVTQ